MITIFTSWKHSSKISKCMCCAYLLLLIILEKILIKKNCPLNHPLRAKQSTCTNTPPLALEKEINLWTMTGQSEWDSGKLSLYTLLVLPHFSSSLLLANIRGRKLIKTYVWTDLIQPFLWLCFTCNLWGEKKKKGWFAHPLIDGFNFLKTINMRN